MVLVVFRSRVERIRQEVANVPVGRSADGRDLFVKRELAVKKDAKVTCSVYGLDN